MEIGSDDRECAWCGTEYKLDDYDECPECGEEAEDEDE